MYLKVQYKFWKFEQILLSNRFVQRFSEVNGYLW